MPRRKKEEMPELMVEIDEKNCEEAEPPKIYQVDITLTLEQEDAEKLIHYIIDTYNLGKEGDGFMVQIVEDTDA